jgi:hypothetical protein
LGKEKVPGSKAPTVKPTHKAVKAYYAALARFDHMSVDHETAVRSAFQTLLADAARSHGWTLVPEQRIKVAGTWIVPDGTLRDEYLPRGYWEAKDTDDDLARRSCDASIPAHSDSLRTEHA